MKMLVTISTLLLAAATAAAAQTPSSSSSTTPTRPVGTSGTPAPATETARPRGTADVAPDYRLVPGDKLRVDVYKDPQLSQSVQVRPDGKITLPLANDITAAGKTPTELRDTITESLKSYIAAPTVTVMVVETVPPTIYVLGEVNQSGPQSLVGRMDVVQAIAAAGGFKDFAKTKDIRIRRNGQFLKFNYKDAVSGRGTPLYLQPGDTIIVP